MVFLCFIIFIYYLLIHFVGYSNVITGLTLTRNIYKTLNVLYVREKERER